MQHELMAIQVRGVTHDFGRKDTSLYVKALLDTSIDIKRGELVSLIGPSGCGKSTLLKIIGGLKRHFTAWRRR